MRPGDIGPESTQSPPPPHPPGNPTIILQSPSSLHVCLGSCLVSLGGAIIRPFVTKLTVSCLSCVSWLTTPNPIHRNRALGEHALPHISAQSASAILSASSWPCFRPCADLRDLRFNKQPESARERAAYVAFPNLALLRLYRSKNAAGFTRSVEATGSPFCRAGTKTKRCTSSRTCSGTIKALS